MGSLYSGHVWGRVVSAFTTAARALECLLRLQAQIQIVDRIGFRLGCVQGFVFCSSLRPGSQRPWYLIRSAKREGPQESVSYKGDIPGRRGPGAHNNILVSVPTKSLQLTFCSILFLFGVGNGMPLPPRGHVARQYPKPWAGLMRNFGDTWSRVIHLVS